MGNSIEDLGKSVGEAVAESLKKCKTKVEMIGHLEAAKFSLMMAIVKV